MRLWFVPDSLFVTTEKIFCLPSIQSFALLLKSEAIFMPKE
jgi:hypothetical protein